eukprot:TRINITY_DN2240_c0_g1_i1.p1 TRINITY_DN2240_c0_g1~~TRINITY_DN2240_c0_g1_i1.p1  ORF type:complete len:348 (+),score=49.94 TRINITY_DN2240_c0_g1_i1:75-1118(+)
MASILKRLIKVAITATYLTIFSILFTILKPFARARNRELQKQASTLSVRAAKKLDCDASSTKIFLPKASIYLHVIEAGNKENPMVVLLHGFPDTWNCWKHIIPVLVKKGYYVVAPDMRGYNLSDKPSGVHNYEIPKLASDVEELITKLNKKTASVVAHDWGGLVAWYFAENYSHMLNHLIILNAPHPEAYMREARRNISQLLSSWYILFFQIPWLPANLITFNPEGASRTIFKTFRKDKVTEEDIKISASAFAQDGALDSMLNYYKALVRSLIKDMFKRKKEETSQITTPTLVLWGENDVALKKELAEASEFVKDFQVVYIPRCSHWTTLDAPEEVEREVIKFLERK